MKKLQMWSNDEEWVIAYDLEDVAAVLREFQGKGGSDPALFEPCDESEAFTFHDGPRDETKKIGEWIAERGRGYFACSDGG